jgi:two-component system, cell cycle sensor histidine kinase and response regulator CckA
MSNKKILVVDDDDGARLAIRYYLEDCGERIVEADGGRSCLRKFEEHGPDVVVLDLRLPDMDGLDVLAMLRARSPDTPVIVVSGTEAIGDVVKSLRLGAWDFLRKPIIDMSMLDHAIDRVRERARLIHENRVYQERLEEQVAIRTEERVQLEQRLRQIQTTESLGVLAGGLAHDFNNLMTIVLTNARLLDGPNADNAVLKELITKAAERAADLTRQLLDYAGKGQFPMKAMEISSAVRSAVSVAGLAISEEAEVVCRHENEPLRIIGDATQIRQIVINLVANAAEALGGKPGVIQVSTGKQRCSRGSLDKCLLGTTLPEGDYIYIAVGDDGEGIHPDEQARIFDPFYSTRFIGRGLGLSAVLGITRRHGGALRVESEQDRGTRVRVLLPDIEAAVEVSASPSPDRDAPEAPRGRIMVVDDEELSRELCRTILGQMGYEVLVAPGAKEAIDLFEENPDAIDCVLLDLVMPNMSGEQCCRVLRGMREDVPVLLTSGYGEQALGERLAESGNLTFLSKPFLFERLEAELENLLAGPEES